MLSSPFSLPGVKLNGGQRSVQVTDMLCDVWVLRTRAETSLDLSRTGDVKTRTCDSPLTFSAADLLIHKY